MTQMQRAETLLQLTNEVVSALILCSSVVPPPPFTKDDGSKDTRWDGEAWLPVGKWKSIAPVNCQRLILWCLGRSPSLRPSAVDIFNTDMNTLFNDPTIHRLVDTYSNSRPGDIKYDTSTTVVVLMRHTFVDTGVSKDIHIITNFHLHEVLRKMNGTMLAKLLGKHVPGAGANSIRVRHVELNDKKLTCLPM